MLTMNEFLNEGIFNADTSEEVPINVVTVDGEAETIQVIHDQYSETTALSEPPREPLTERPQQAGATEAISLGLAAALIITAAWKTPKKSQRYIQ